jgi:hypothetical protein
MYQTMLCLTKLNNSRVDSCRCGGRVRTRSVKGEICFVDGLGLHAGACVVTTVDLCTYSGVVKVSSFRAFSEIQFGTAGQKLGTQHME